MCCYSKLHFYLYLLTGFYYIVYIDKFLDLPGFLVITLLRNSALVI